MEICNKNGCNLTPDYKIICDQETLLGCESHAMELIGTFYGRTNRKENPKIEKLTPLQNDDSPVSLVEDAVKKQAVLINENNVGTGKANLINVARALSDQKKLDDAGFPKLETYFAVGTPLAKSGVENFSRERQSFQKLEPVSSGMKKLALSVKKENRSDLIIDVKELTATEDFKIKIPGHGDYFCGSRQALASLMDFTPLGMNITRYLSKCSPELRAKNINHWLSLQSKTAKLRVRDGMAGPEIFAVVTESYTPLDVDKIAEIIGEEAPKEARTEIVYDGQTARMYVLFHTDLDPAQGVVGEVFKAGSMLKTDDTGGGSITGRAVAWRALCLNFTNMMTSKEVGRRKHVGSEDFLRAAVKTYLKDAMDRVEPFTAAWGFASQENILDTAISIEPGETIKPSDLFDGIMGLFAGSLERELIPVRGRRSEQLTELMNAWGKEPGNTRTHFVNSITRYAHESPQRGPWDEDEFQDAASDILFSKKPLPYVNPVKNMAE